MKFPDNDKNPSNRLSYGPKNGDGPGYGSGPGYGQNGILDDDEENSTNLLTDPLAILFLLLDKWWIIAITTLLVSIAGIGYIYFTKPYYRSSARIEVVTDSRLATARVSDFQRLNRSLNRHILVFQSPELSYTVSKNLEPIWGDILNEEERIVEKNFEIVRASNNTMLDITVDAVDVEYAQQYLEQMIEVYRDQRIRDQVEVNENAVSGLKVEEATVLKDLELAKQELREFEAINNVYIAQQREVADSAMLNQLVAQLKKIKMEKTLLESQYSSILEQDAATIREVLLMTRKTMSTASDIVEPTSSSTANQNRSVTRFLSNDQESAMDTTDSNAIVEWENQLEGLSSLKAEYEERLKVFKPTHPSMVSMKSEIDTMELNLNNKADIALKRFTAYYDALIMQEEGLETAINDWEQEQTVSIQLLNKYNQLVSQVDLLEKKYDLVYARLLDSSNESDILYIRTLKAPDIRETPVKPDRLRIFIVAIVAGAAMGVVIILLLEVLKPQLINFEDIEKSFNLNCLASIPRWDMVLGKKFDINSSPFVIQNDDHSPALETYRAIRSKLAMLFEDKEQFVLTLTSPKTGDGKSFTTANIALPYSWDGVRVLVVDADFRKSSLTRNLLKTNTRFGLTNYMRGENVNLDDLICTIYGTQLDFLPSGQYSNSIPELVKERKVRELYSYLKKKYDVILVDTAPATMVVETANLCRAADGTLIVASENSRKTDFKYILRELNQVNIIGFCINQLTPLRRKAYSYYEYRYGNYRQYAQYGYGYGYSNTHGQAGKRHKHATSK